MKDSRFNLVSFKDIEEENVEWLWEPYIPIGKISFLAGDPGVGKSFVAIFIASAVSKGDKFPFSKDDTPIGNVIIQNSEDGKGDTIKKRLNAFNADNANVYIMELKNERENENDLLLTDVEEIERMLAELRPLLVIFDTITTFLGDIDMNSATKVRKVLRPIAKLAEKYNCAIVFVIHRNKGIQGGNQLHRLLGSVDFGGIARSVISIGTTRDKSETLFMHTKSNVSSLGKTLAFSINEEKLEWLGTRDYLQDDELLNIVESKKSLKDVAIDFIIEYLETHGKSKYSDMVYMASKYGITEKTLNRARDDLKEEKFIDKEYQNRDVYWFLSEDISPIPQG